MLILEKFNSYINDVDMHSDEILQIKIDVW